MAAPKRIWLIVAFAALYLIWGSTYLGIRFAIETIPPFLMAGTRFFLAGVIMYAIARAQDGRRSTWAEWRTALIVGACLLLGGNGGVTLSEKYIDSGLAAVMTAFAGWHGGKLVFDHGIGEFLATALRIEIFAAENQCTIAFAGALVGDPKGASMAEMEKARGRRGEASAIGR